MDGRKSRACERFGLGLLDFTDMLNNALRAAPKLLSYHAFGRLASRLASASKQFRTAA